MVSYVMSASVVIGRVGENVVSVVLAYEDVEALSPVACFVSVSLFWQFPKEVSF